MLAIGIVGVSLGPIFVWPSKLDNYPAFASLTTSQWQIIGAYCACLACVDTWAWQNQFLNKKDPVKSDLSHRSSFQFTTKAGLLLIVNISACLGILNALNV